ncbi:hypothetical protein ZIOFF_005442 [Zingiber officinale]|uniref:Legume lectin domain-containing protein n=1 Tax=Zingiber officinale TaxID=94328 RepID=A0A8J5M1K5_ZINOF|nr:hypothetical protein ZIOFF_005442 [Zingiber officinale]
MTTSSTASALILAIVLLLFAPLSPGNCASTGEGNALFFSFGGSGKNRSFATEFALYGDAEMNSSEVRVTRAANESSGLMIYWKPVRFFGTKPGFSSSFSFSVSPGNGGGLAFFLSPVSVPLEPATGDWSRLSTSVVAVKFVTAASLVEVDVGGELLTKSRNLSDDGLLLVLSRGEKLHSWIDYDGESKRIEVRLCQDKDPKEAAPSISHSIDLSYMLWREASWVGLSSWSGNSSHGSSIYSWNFTEKHGAPYLMHSEPLDPNSFVVRSKGGSRTRAYPWGVFVAMLVAAACGAILTFFTMIVWYALVSRRPVAPVEYPAHAAGVAYGKIESVGDKVLENCKK